MHDDSASASYEICIRGSYDFSSTSPLLAASNRLGTVGGIPANHVNKAFEILNALGAIGFAYSFSSILVEIQDTLRQASIYGWVSPSAGMRNGL